MEANVTLDVGNNITMLIEKLASTIGTTTEKVFPWYVREVQIDGYTSLFISLFFIFVCICLWIYVACSKKDLNDSCVNSRIIVTIIASVITFAVLLGGSMSIGSTMKKILNPEKQALSHMIYDVSRLVK